MLIMVAIRKGIDSVLGTCVLLWTNSSFVKAFFFIFMWINGHFLVYEMVFVVFKDVMINTWSKNIQKHLFESNSLSRISSFTLWAWEGVRHRLLLGYVLLYFNKDFHVLHFFSLMSEFHWILMQFSLNYTYIQ